MTMPAAPPPEASPTPMFDFSMRVIERDRDGYYYPRWDRATPLVVRAENRAAAFEQAWAVMGDCPRGRGWTWTAKIDQIERVSS